MVELATQTNTITWFELCMVWTATFGYPVFQLALYMLSQYRLVPSMFIDKRPGKQLDAVNRVTAALHATIATVLAIIVLIQGPYDNDGCPVQTGHILLAVGVCLEIGYLIQDTLIEGSTFLMNNHSGPGVSILFHHIGFLSILPWYFILRIGDYPIAMLMLANSSTPLLHGRYFVRKAYGADHPSVKGLELSLAATFATMRLIPPFIYWHTFARCAGLSMLQAALSVPLWMSGGTATVICLNLYWLYMMAAASKGESKAD